MPISGLVVTLRNGRERDAIDQIRQHPRFETGSHQSQRLPVVLDTPDRDEDKRCWQWLNALDGVDHVDVAMVHFEDADAQPATCCHPSTDRPIARPTIGET